MEIYLVSLLPPSVPKFPIKVCNKFVSIKNINCFNFVRCLLAYRWWIWHVLFAFRWARIRQGNPVICWSEVNGKYAFSKLETAFYERDFTSHLFVMLENKFDWKGHDWNFTKAMEAMGDVALVLAWVPFNGSPTDWKNEYGLALPKMKFQPRWGFWNRHEARGDIKVLDCEPYFNIYKSLSDQAKVDGFRVRSSITRKYQASNLNNLFISYLHKVGGFRARFSILHESKVNLV